MFLTALALTLTPIGCLRAASPVVDEVGSAVMWQGHFEVAAPPGWEVTRNRRWFNNHMFTLTAPDGRDAINIELIKETGKTRDLPLVLMSDVLAMNIGRKVGVEPELIGQNELLVANRQAWATTLIRRHGPNERLASVVTLRGQDHIVMLTLNTVPGGISSSALAWQLVIDTFDLPTEPVPPDPPMEDLLMFPPSD